MSIARTLSKLTAYQAVSADTLSYGNEATTGSTVKAALDWVFAALYPNTKDSVDIPADLPASGNTLNDYRVVLDDGDGKAAGYRWEQREGDAAPKWYKVHDMDWSSDAILASLQDIAQELYVFRGGRTDLDDSGNPITGLYAGQTIYGGSASGQNLTLNANSGDGTGPQSGYVQFDGDTRPTNDSSFDLGTLTERFRDIFLTGNLSDGTGNDIPVSDIVSAFGHSQITDGSNPHDTGYDSLSDKLGTVTVDGDASGSVDLSSSGDKTLTLTITDDSHNHTVSTITDFDSGVYAANKSVLIDSGNITWTKTDLSEEISGDVTVDTSDITDIASPMANHLLASNSAGDEWIAIDGGISLSGAVAGSAVYDSVNWGWDISTTLNPIPISKIQEINITTKTWTAIPSSPTQITAPSHGLQTGEKVSLFGDIFGLFDVTRVDADTFTIPGGQAVPASGYYIPQGGQLLWNAASNQFTVAKEFEEISHSELSNLLSDDHTQYVAKDGRSGGQTVKGGTGASQNLTLQSTDSATRGVIQTSDPLVPTSTAAYSGGWSGTDLGSPTQKWNDLYMAGEAKGLRAENVGALPSNSGTTIGRLVFFGGVPYFDTGSEWVSGGGGGPYAVTTKSANYTATDDDDVIICNGTFTVSLPDTATLDVGDQIIIKNIGTGTITIDPFASQTVDGQTLYEIVDQWAAATLVCDGTNWIRI